MFLPLYFVNVLNATVDFWIIQLSMLQKGKAQLPPTVQKNLLERNRPVPRLQRREFRVWREGVNHCCSHLRISQSGREIILKWKPYSGKRVLCWRHYRLMNPQQLLASFNKLLCDSQWADLQQSLHLWQILSARWFYWRKFEK